MKAKSEWKRSHVYLTVVFALFFAGTVAALSLRAIASANDVKGRLEARIGKSTHASPGVQTVGANSAESNKAFKIATHYAGPQYLQESLQNNSTPLSMASADFDEDGAPDLVSGYISSGIGIMTLHRGKRSLETSSESDPIDNTEAIFAAQTQISELPDTPDFLLAGDFDADRHSDIVVAARGRRTLFLLSGNGHGEFSQASSFELGGEITAVAARDNTMGGLPADLAVAVHSDRVSRVLVYAGAQGSLSAKAREIELTASASGLVFGHFDGDDNVDVAATTDIDLIVVNSRGGWAQDARLSVTQRSFPFPLKSLTVGDFNGDGWSDIVVLSSEGAVHVFANPRKSGKKSAIGRWKESSVAGGSDSESVGLVRARFGASEVDDLVMLDSLNHQLHIAALPNSSESSNRPATINMDGDPVAVLPMRLYDDEIEDLIVMEGGRSTPRVVSARFHIQGQDQEPGVYRITKTGSPNPVTAGNVITYTILIENLFGVAMTNVTFSDPVPVNTTFVSVSPPAGWSQTQVPPVGGSGPIGYSIASWPANSVQTFTVVVRVNPNVPTGTNIQNAATLTFVGGGNEIPPITAPETTPVNAPPPPPPGQPSLIITKTASQSTVSAGSDVTYTINVSNVGQGTASNVDLLDNINPTLSVKSCSFGCGAGITPVQTTIPSLVPGQSQSFIIIATVKCDTPAGIVGNTAIASIPGGQSVTSSPANITVTNSGALRLSTTQSSTIDFGTVGLGATVTRDLIVENTFAAACPTFFNTTSLNRSGPDVSRISNRADTTFFRITRTDGTAVNLQQSVTLNPGLTTFRVIFSPNAPSRPGTNTNLSASQVLPTNLTSQLAIAGIATPVTLTAGVSRTVRIIGNVSLSVTGDTFNVSVDVFSPDFTDVTTFTVKLLDAQNNTVAENTANVASAIQQANLVRGQTFGLVQTGSGIGDKQVSRAEVTVSGPGGSAGPIRSAAATQSSNPTHATASRYGNNRTVFADVRLRR